MFIDGPMGRSGRIVRSNSSSNLTRPIESQSSEAGLFETELETVGRVAESYNEDSDYYYEEVDKENVYAILDGRHLSWRQRLQDIFEGRPHSRDQRLHIAFNVVSVSVVLLSIVVFCLMTLPDYVGSRLGLGFTVENELFWLDTACILFFFVEAACRVFCSPSLHRVLDVFLFIDVLTIVGYVVDVIVDVFTSRTSGTAFVRILRLFRVFRVFKLSRHSKSLQLVLLVLRKSASGLTVLLLPLAMLVLIISSLIYFLEVSDLTWDDNARLWRTGEGYRGDFQSIPDAIWFTSSTVTTVGFGDIVPRSTGGKICAVVASFSGILILSFPNIVLGGNLQFAFRKYYRLRARRGLGKKFRKMLHIIVFVNEVRRLAQMKNEQGELSKPQSVTEEGERMLIHEDQATEKNPNAVISSDQAKSEDTPAQASALPVIRVSRSTPSPLTRKMQVNYLATKSELDLYRKAAVGPITEDNVRQWMLNGISAVSVLVRLLELCSGVGTTQEIHRSFVKSGKLYSSTDIAVVALYLMEAELLQVFVFRRGATNMLLSLTPKSVMELLVHREEGDIECIRSSDVARIVWKRTTLSQPTFSLQLLMANFHHWASTECLVDNAEHTANVDFKITFWKLAERIGSSSKPSGKNTNSSSSVKLSDAKTTMISLLTQQAQRIKEMEELIARHTSEGPKSLESSRLMMPA